MPDQKPQFNTRKPYRSSSSIDTFARCPEQWRRAYVMKDKRPPGRSSARGGSVHVAAAADLNFKIVTSELLALEEVQQIARDSLESKWADVELTTAERSEGKQKVKGRTVDETIGAITEHHLELAPTLKPIAVERQFVVEVDNFPVDLAGVIDVLQGAELNDLKTSGKAPHPQAGQTSGQLTLYAMAARTLGIKNPTLWLDYVVLYKKKGPTIIRRKGTRTQEQMYALLQRIYHMERSIEAGIFVPTNPDNWWCSPDYCGYYDTCAYVQKKPVSMGIPLPVLDTLRGAG